MMTHRPRDDKVVGGVAAAHHVVRVLEGHILGGEAHLGVARGQTVANLRVIFIVNIFSSYKYYFSLLLTLFLAMTLKV